jgi:hypothetical protein
VVAEIDHAAGIAFEHDHHALADLRSGDSHGLIGSG